MPRGGQLARQWRLLQFLDKAAGVTVEDAARELGCAVRTIWRDIRVLEDAGFPLSSERAADGRRGVFRLDPAFRARLPLKLTLSELAALLMSRQLLAPLGVSVLGPAVSSAFDKIAAVLSREAIALLDAMRATVGARTLGAKLQGPAADLLPRIQQALLDRRTLRVRYHSFQRDEESDRELDPYHLTYHAGGLYLVAYCHTRRDVRLFAVERFRAAEVTRRTFAVRPGFDAEAYLDTAWGVVQGQLVTVTVVFSRTVARYVGERLWHPSQRLRPLSDGRLEMTLRVADTLEVRRWILGYGAEAEVLEPASLREALRLEAEAVARQLAPRRRPLAAVRGGAGGQERQADR
jgi:predicted DNA-binding transcriptional regulator YafY